MTFTSMSFKSSKATQQPLPDRYFTWLTVVQDGVVPIGGAAANYYGQALNDIVTPFNKSNSLSKIPTPLTANSSLNPTGLSTLLFNSGTNGLYKYFRVWTVEQELTWGPQNALDDIHVALAAVVDANNNFGSFAALEQAPGSVVKTCNSGGSPQSGVLRNTYSIPALKGIPPSLYSADTACVGTYTVPPTQAMYMQYGYLLTDGGTAVAPIAIRAKTKYHVEFFGRQDATLSIT